MDNLLEYLQSVGPFFVYVGLFIGAFLENIFPPVPGDTIVVFGAYLVGLGTLNFFIAFLSTTAGSVLGFMTCFYVGRLIDRKIVKSGRSRFITPGQYLTVEKWFDRYGYGIIAVNRFLSGLRSIISIAAGIVRLNPLKVFMYALLSCVIWNFILIYAGYSLGDNWGVVIDYIKQYNVIVFIVVSIILLVYFLARAFIFKKN
ncbi:DedA family protein [candidate division KSB1 bacterium]